MYLKLILFYIHHNFGIGVCNGKSEIWLDISRICYTNLFWNKYFEYVVMQLNANHLMILAILSQEMEFVSL